MPHDDVDVQKKIPPPVVLPKSKPTDPVQMQESLEGKSPADCHETGHEIGTNDKHDSEIGCYESEDVQEVHLTPKGSEREGEDKEGSDNFTGMAVCTVSFHILHFCLGRRYIPYVAWQQMVLPTA